MTKSKDKRLASPLPLPPVIYLNDPLKLAYALVDYLPSYTIVDTIHPPARLETALASDDEISIIIDQKKPTEQNVARKTAEQYRQACIKRGCNFVSVDMSCSVEEMNTTAPWATNHLDIYYETEVECISEKIYNWLFKVLTVQESLHLIPEKTMMAIDTKSFPDYEYCSIADAHKRPKDAKIQFVVLITSKPQVGANKRISWTVADKTGTANFYFQWRGGESKYTWDWVLKLEPGDRRSLPRMPYIQIKEKKRVRIVKAPVRGVATVVSGTGLALRGLGRGLCAVGNAVKMGHSSEWVAEADVKDGKKIKEVGVRTAMTGPKKELKIFNEKGQGMWKDDDSIASTTASSVFNEKKLQEFY